MHLLRKGLCVLLCVSQVKLKIVDAGAIPNNSESQFQALTPRNASDNKEVRNFGNKTSASEGFKKADNFGSTISNTSDPIADLVNILSTIGEKLCIPGTAAVNSTRRKSPERQTRRRLRRKSPTERSKKINIKTGHKVDRYWKDITNALKYIKSLLSDLGLDIKELNNIDLSDLKGSQSQLVNEVKGSATAMNKTSGYSEDLERDGALVSTNMSNEIGNIVSILPAIGVNLAGLAGTCITKPVEANLTGSKRPTGQKKLEKIGKPKKNTSEIAQVGAIFKDVAEAMKFIRIISEGLKEQSAGSTEVNVTATVSPKEQKKVLNTWLQNSKALEGVGNASQIGILKEGSKQDQNKIKSGK